MRQIELIERDSNNAIAFLCAERALEEARAADDALAMRRGIGPAHGVPFTVKDVIATAGVRSTAGSRLLAHYVPEADAPAVARLRAAGGILMAKTNCSEFALTPRADNQLLGRTRNPRDSKRSPGGSSGGCAAAVAGGLSPLSLGTDYGGSVRFPAHCCGVLGMRPSTGRVPGDGQIPYPPAGTPRRRYAVIGPLARTSDDLRLAVRVISARRRATAPRDISALCCAWTTSGAGVAIPDALASAVGQAAEMLRDSGVKVVRRAPPGWTAAEKLFAALRETDTYSDLRALSRGRESLVGEHVASLLATAPIRSTAARRVLLRRMLALRGRVMQFMEKHPVLLTPVAATSAYALDSEVVEVRGRHLVIDEMKMLSPCRAVSLLGLPALSFPLGRTDRGLPVGVQIVGKPFQEECVFAVAAVFERALRSSA